VGLRRKSAATASANRGPIAGKSGCAAWLDPRRQFAMILGAMAAMITRAGLLSTEEIREARHGAALVFDDSLPGDGAGPRPCRTPRRSLLAGRRRQGRHHAGAADVDVRLR